MPNTTSGGMAPSTFDPSLEYSTDKAVFGQPPSFFSQWYPSLFVVDDLSYSCAEQFMMVEKSRLFKDHRAVELIMSPSDPSTHKRVGRGVRNFDTAVSDREKPNAVLSGNDAKFTQNPAMKLHLRALFNKRLAEASTLDPVWGIGLRADDPRAKDPHKWRGKHLLGEALSAVREAIRDSEAGSPHPSSPRRFRSPTGNAGIHEISSAQSRLGTAVGADQGPPSAYFLGAPADQSPEVLAIASRGASDRALPEHGPCLTGGTVTLDDVSFTTDVAVHSGEDAIAPYRCTFLLDTGSPQTFIRRDVLDRMLSVGAASSACERSISPRSWGGFGESAPLRTAIHIRLSVQFFHKKDPPESRF